VSRIVGLDVFEKRKSLATTEIDSLLSGNVSKT
jgi:hypothetical protein